MRDDFVLSLDGDGADGAPSPSTILLVDDDADMRSLTRTFLEHEGYSVFTSGDADRAAQIFSSVPRIDLLITDMYMPGRSGMELAFDMKTMRPNLPILMISGGFVDDDVKERLLHESWRFLSKPFRLTELLAAVHLMLAECEPKRSRVL
jgi:two-component system, chemotaxis family, chemotaxis protein CheY